MIWYNCNINLNLKYGFLFACNICKDASEATGIPVWDIISLPAISTHIFLGTYKLSVRTWVCTINWLLVGPYSLSAQRRSKDDLYYFCNIINIPHFRNSSIAIYFRQWCFKRQEHRQMTKIKTRTAYLTSHVNILVTFWFRHCEVFHM